MLLPELAVAAGTFPSEARDCDTTQPSRATYCQLPAPLLGHLPANVKRERNPGSIWGQDFPMIHFPSCQFLSCSCPAERKTGNVNLRKE